MTMGRSVPTTCDDTIDSRDVIARIEELESERADLLGEVEEAQEALDEVKRGDHLAACDWVAFGADCSCGHATAVEEAEDALKDATLLLLEWDGNEGDVEFEGIEPVPESDEAEELRHLKALADDAEGYASDWRHGCTLINEDYFVKYAEQLAEDIGAIDRHASWPLSYINWEAAAEALKMDYTSVDFNGTTFYVR
jgi:hypothetical protein